jgi:hypothetical protein
MHRECSAATTGILGDLGGLVTSFVRHVKAENKSQQTRMPDRYAAEGLCRFLAERGMRAPELRTFAGSSNR